MLAGRLFAFWNGLFSRSLFFLEAMTSCHALADSTLCKAAAGLARPCCRVSWVYMPCCKASLAQLVEHALCKGAFPVNSFASGVAFFFGLLPFCLHSRLGPLSFCHMADWTQLKMYEGLEFFLFRFRLLFWCPLFCNAALSSLGFPEQPLPLPIEDKVKSALTGFLKVPGHACLDSTLGPLWLIPEDTRSLEVLFMSP